MTVIIDLGKLRVVYLNICPFWEENVRLLNWCMWCEACVVCPKKHLNYILSGSNPGRQHRTTGQGRKVQWPFFPFLNSFKVKFFACTSRPSTLNKTCKISVLHTRCDLWTHSVKLSEQNFEVCVYSLVPIRRQCPINSHASRHGTCNGP